MTYTAFSCATKIGQIDLIGVLNYDRLTKFKESTKFKGRVPADEKLKQREVQSMELNDYFQYHDNDINYTFD